MNPQIRTIRMTFNAARFLRALTRGPASAMELVRESGFPLMHVHRLLTIGVQEECVDVHGTAPKGRRKGPRPELFSMPNERDVLKKFALIAWNAQSFYSDVDEDLPVGPEGAWAGAFMALFQANPKVAGIDAARALCGWQKDERRLLGSLKTVLYPVSRAILRRELLPYPRQGEIAWLELIDGMEEELEFSLWPSATLKRMLPQGV